MGPDDKKDSDKKVEGVVPERRRVALIIESSPDITLSKATLKAALDEVLGPDNGVEIVSITRTKGNMNIN